MGVVTKRWGGGSRIGGNRSGRNRRNDTDTDADADTDATANCKYHGTSVFRRNVVVVVAVAANLVVAGSIAGLVRGFGIGTKTTTTTTTNTKAVEHKYEHEHEYELFPFLVDPSAVTAATAATTTSTSTNATTTATASTTDLLLSTPTLPPFPVIERLEQCLLHYKPANTPRNNHNDQPGQEWRKMFWIPSYPGSGASNPTRKGDLLRSLVEGLFLGELVNRANANGNANANANNAGYGKPVKDFHMSMKGKDGKNALKRCSGISETIGCTSNHPVVDTRPLSQTRTVRPEVILPIRNPATVLPEYFTNKHVAYHKGKKQPPVEHWRANRDAYLDGSLKAWMDVIRYWRGATAEATAEATATAKEPSSSSSTPPPPPPPYYRVELYVPYEDIVTTDSVRGTDTVRRLSDLLSGRTTSTTSTATSTATNTTMQALSSHPSSFFETSPWENDYECLWYRTAKQEWEREQTLSGDYVPKYTQSQKSMMVGNLTAYADEIEAEARQFGGNSGNGRDDKGDGDAGTDTDTATTPTPTPLASTRAADAVLVSLLRRYADQIERFVLVEDPVAVKDDVI
mmetsp:Transcript_13877/g.29200  ORF Transcript_13877/g.29200 Transcript_13877/m.29200 type:complete len:572 (+) Transcript_13877:208-1923(+)